LFSWEILLYWCFVFVFADGWAGGFVDKSRSYLKKAFWPNLIVGVSFQVLEIPVSSSGLKLGSAAILDQNLFFEVASNEFIPDFAKNRS